MEKREGGHRGGRHHRDSDPNVLISKNLAWLLRHGAEKEKLSMDAGGWVPLDEILKKDFYKTKHIGVDKIKDIVDSNDKKRFELKTEANASGVPVLYIRASQGHTLKSVSDEDLLEKIINAAEIPVCIHGTYRDAWELIKKTGLKPMSRNHVHFAVGYPGENGVISGMRTSCSVFIELDVEKALADGIEIFKSKNGVILSRGIDGFIKPEYFKKVLKKVKADLKEVDPSEYKTAST